jgi:membrane associated rhomboid family serine protease
MTGPVGLLLVIITTYVSYRGFKDLSFFNANTFEVEKILGWKEYKRIFTSGFLHTSWRHLLLNMISLYLFSHSVEGSIGPLYFLLIYLASLIGGNLFALYIYRHQSSYSAVGASGAVCGIIFSAIALHPGMRIGMFMLPVSLPSWLYGFLYVMATIYGIKSRRDNIGHEAHFGGALIGLAITLILFPETIVYNYWAILLIVIPSAFFIYQIIRYPHGFVTGTFSASRNYETVDDRYYASQKKNQEELDLLLEKIHSKGIDSLTKQERERLDQLAEKSKS